MSTPLDAGSRIFLSPPHLGPAERDHVADAFATNWIAPVGPHLSAFEGEFCAATGAKAAVCLSSGTAALHLAVRLLGIGPGDDVFCSTFTFVASANPIVYQGGHVTFVDADLQSWNMDPNLLADALAARARAGRLPKAIIIADIYGQSADWDSLSEVAARYDIPMIEDAAEAVGATYRGKWAGRFGRAGIYSFNGNKILTTGGGGMIVSDDVALIEKAAWLAAQAREEAPHYEHRELGYNYRLSNVLAAIGRGQLSSLSTRIERKREIFAHYVRALGDLPGVSFMPELSGSRSTRWLTCLSVDETVSGVKRDTILAALDADNIEARPLWKPLHCQPYYRSAERFGGENAEKLFSDGLCLPSGTAMTTEELDRVVAAFRRPFQG